MDRVRRLRTVLLLAAGALGAGAAAAQQEVEAPSAALYQVAPDFALTDLDGRRRISGKLWGERASLLVFVRQDAAVAARLAAIECRGRHEPPLAGRGEAAGGPAAQQHGTADLQHGLLGILVVDLSPGYVDSSALAELYSGAGLGAPVLRDPGREVANIYGVEALPSAFVLDGRREVRLIAEPSDGELDPAVETELRDLLADPD